MMRNPESTIGNLIDKQKTAYISSIDSNGFPNTKAMLAPRKKRRNKKIFILQQILHQ